MTDPTTDDQAQPAQQPTPHEAGSVAARERWRTFGAPALAAVTVVALCLGVLLGWLAFAPRYPGDTSAEAGFARDMTEHHAQATQMSLLVMQRTEDESVRRLAADVVNNQEFERGVMASWLTQWGLPRARGGERMAWMEGHDHAALELPSGVPMPGMATPSEIQALTDARGQEAEVLYLQLLTTHHLAGVEMAQAALAQADDPDVRAVAQRMVSAQSGEVALMRDMLLERDATPREDVDAWLAEQAAADGAGSTQDHGSDH